MKLHRNEDEGMIGGVCAGLGETYNIDESIIRMFWTILALCYGVGLVAYLLAWIIIPDKD